MNTNESNVNANESRMKARESGMKVTPFSILALLTIVASYNLVVQMVQQQLHLASSAPPTTQS